MHKRRLLAVAAMLGAATFGMLEAAQSVLRADRSFAEPMSAYAVGPYGFVQTVAFVVLALGSAAVCAALSSRRRPPHWQVARGLIGVWSLGVSLAAVFRIDVDGSRPSAGQVHAAASMLSFVAILAAMFFFAHATRQVAEWRSFGRLSAALAGTAAVTFILAGATQPSITFGVAQRVFLAAVVAWLVAIGGRLYTLGRTGNVNKLRHALEAYNAGDLSPLADLLDPAVDWQGVDGMGIRPCRDRAAVLATMRHHLESGFRLEDMEMAEVGNQVVVGFRSPVAASHATEPRLYNVFTFDAGQVIHIQDYREPSVRWAQPA